jgi:hypothetical protein
LDLDSRVPMRWPCGPLEIERAKRREGFTAREAEALERWSQPGALERLAGTAVNCLVVTWSDGAPGDEAQQRALVPLIGAARRLGLSVVGEVAGKAELGRAVEAARAAGLAAVATGSGDPVEGFPVLRFRARGFEDRSRVDFLGVVGNVWPGLKLDEAEGVDATTGPTGTPWLDSNAWYVRLARAILEPKTLWLSFDPPAIGRPVPADAYVQAIADTEVYGARWVVSLDPFLRADLAEERASALETWAGIGRALAFFRTHRVWSAYPPVGQLGVVSDYSGGNEFLSFEVLNLLGRQGCLYRILEKSRALAAPFDGLDAVLYVDEAPPEKALVQKLYAYAEEGGTLIAPPGWEERGVRDDVAGLPGFRVFRCGRGRLAVAHEEAADPGRLAEDAQVLMSHRHDLLRLFNVGAVQLHYCVGADGRSGILHLLGYPMQGYGGLLSVWFRRPWASGRTWGVDSGKGRPAERKPVPPGVEFHLPPLGIYSALEVGS